MIDLATPEDVAARFGVTPLALIRFARKHQVPLVEITRGKYRIAPNSVDAIYRAKGLPPPERRVQKPNIANIEFLSGDEIVRRSAMVGSLSGVYFLIRGGRVVYVGQSLNVYNRLETHKKTRRFDTYFIMPCAPDVLDIVEDYYIKTLWPEENNDMSSQLNRRKAQLRE